MKNLLSYIGWLLFLATVAVGLILYNAVHVPTAGRLARQQSEIGMWTTEVESLRGQVARAAAPPETAFAGVFTFDELFGSSETFAIGAGGESTLRGIVTMLQQSSGTVMITGHTDAGELPAKVKGLYPSQWHFTAAAAAAVARGLAGWGIAAERILARGAGGTRPRDSNSTPEGRIRNRRVEILVLKDR
jgi:outer membrane protein OmpA-like peptidoglycan-associated protein